MTQTDNTIPANTVIPITAHGPNITTEQEAELALLLLLRENSWAVTLGFFAVGLWVFALVFGRVPIHGLIIWFVLFCIAQILRYWVHSHVCQNAQLPIACRMNYLRYSSVYLGLVLGTIVFSYPYIEDSERNVLSLALFAIASAAISHLRGCPKIYHPYLLSLLLPLTVTYANTSIGIHWWTSWMIIVLVIVCIANLWIYARSTWNHFITSCRIRLQERQYNEMLSDLVEKAKSDNLAKTKFLASTSHDLKQPLHTISLLIGAIKVRQFSQDNQDIVQLLERVVNDLSHLIDELLDISKLESGVLATQPEIFRLDLFLQRQFQGCRHWAETKGLNAVIEINTEVYVSTDPQLLARILHNLFHNAVKYTERGTVTLALRRENGRAFISISDTGKGIPAAKQSEIFQEFVQLDNPEQDPGKGMGLGLAIVKKLTELLNINIFLRSEVDVGSTFTVSLPIIGPNEDFYPV